MENKRHCPSCSFRQMKILVYTTLIDWHSAAINHPENFEPDGVHLVPGGVKTVTNLIQQVINIGTNKLA
ncbi:hypothetical protein [Lysinibacillus sp. NPDC093216]|uniref:hypothetical protein n=1 Tax=Lysinibacillus sp. NPDC093216 TaxID=3390576 RepID=UPI003D017BA6